MSVVTPMVCTVPPEFGGTAQVPSPRQNVVAEAPVPLFRFPTGRFPVTSDDSETEPVVQVEVAVRFAIPKVVSPSRAARSSASDNEIEPLVVIGPPETVMPAEGAVRFTDVTVPPEPAETALQTPSPRR